MIQSLHEVSAVTVKLSERTRAELEAVLGSGRLALLDLGGRKVLVQVVEDGEEFDLDAFLDEHPGAAEGLREAIAEADAGKVISHDEVKRRLGLKNA